MAIYEMTTEQIYFCEFYIENSTIYNNSNNINLTNLVSGDILLDTTNHKIKIVPTSNEWQQLHGSAWINTPSSTDDIKTKEDQVVVFCHEQPYEDHGLSPHNDILDTYLFSSIDAQGDNKEIMFARPISEGPFPNYYNVKSSTEVNFVVKKGVFGNNLNKPAELGLKYYTLTLTPNYTNWTGWGQITFLNKRSVKSLKDLFGHDVWTGYIID